MEGGGNMFDDAAASLPGPSSRPPTPPNPELRRIYGIQYPDADFVQRAGSWCQIEGVPDNVAAMIAHGVRNHIKTLITEASTFAIHGRRARLIPQDVDDALRFMGMQPLYGIRSQHGEPFRFSGSMGKELVLKDIGEIELSPLISAPPPRMPLEPQLKPHWLVIDGVQPAVPENPIPITHQNVFGLDGINNAGGENGRSNSNGTSNTVQLNNGAQPTKGGDLANKTITTHNLSLEQQVFFKEIVESIVGLDEDKRNEALHCLQTDRGLNSMTSRFILTIVEGVRTNIGCRNLHCLQQLMRMTHALLSNRSINMQRSLHDLIPSILSCIVARRLSTRPAIDNHWSLREAAAKIIAILSNSYDIGMLRARIAHLLMKSFTPHKGRRPAMATIYGATFALNELGLETVRTLIIPRAPKLYTDIQEVKARVEQPPEKKVRNEEGEEESSQEESGIDDQNDEKKGAKKLEELITSILTNYVRASRPPTLRDLSDYTGQLGGFADEVYRAAVTDLTSRTTSSTVGGTVAPSSSSSSSSHRMISSGRGGHYGSVSAPRTQSGTPSSIRRPGGYGMTTPSNARGGGPTGNYYASGDYGNGPSNTTYRPITQTPRSTNQYNQSQQQPRYQ